MDVGKDEQNGVDSDDANKAKQNRATVHGNGESHGVTGNPQRERVTRQ